MLPLSSQTVTAGFTLTFLIGLAYAVTQALKILVVQPLVKDTDPRQNMLIRVVAFVIAYCIVIINTAVATQVMSFAAAWTLLPTVITVWLGATGGYSLVKAPDTAPPQTPPLQQTVSVPSVWTAPQPTSSPILPINPDISDPSLISPPPASKGTKRPPATS